MKNVTLLIIIILLLLTILMISGCSFHYYNEKGVQAELKDVKTQVGSVQDANGHFYSTLDIWFPWKPKAK